MAENLKMKTKVKEFIYYYLRSMRLYYSFVTGVSTLAGVVAAIGSGAEWNGRVVFVLARRLFCFPREKSTRRRCGWSSR